MLIQVYCDGASRGQGQGGMGEAACAVVIYKNHREVVRFARGLGKRTNNEAEYEAVIAALLMCSSDPDYKDPIIYSDSAVVVNHVIGKWECKNDALLPLLMTVKEIQSEYRFRIQQVPRKEVHEADSLAKQFLDQLDARKAEIAKELDP